MRRSFRTFVAAPLLLVLAAPARATWSIAAVDPVTLEVGVAGASCIGGVQVIVGLAPGRAAVAAQAFANQAGKERLLALLREGAPPAEALADVASPAFEETFGVPLQRLRQYGIAALDPHGGAATYTGEWNGEWAGAREGDRVAVQGNLLRGSEVLESTLSAFVRADDPACPRNLADRLLDALEAGAAAGGDRRCSAELAALSAVLAVAGPRDPPERPGLWLTTARPGSSVRTPWTPADLWLRLQRALFDVEIGSREESPVVLLRERYEAERRPRTCAVALPSRIRPPVGPGTRTSGAGASSTSTRG